MLARIQPHLFWDCAAYRHGSIGKTYYIKNSSKRKIRDRRRLKRLYMINLWNLILAFEEDNDSEMTIHYLNRYSYLFQRACLGRRITVYKTFEGSRPLPWAYYPAGQFPLVEWDLMSKILLPKSYFTMRADLFSGVVKSAQAESCLICKGCVEYDEEYVKRMERVEEVKNSLRLEQLTIHPICVKCAIHSSIISTLFREVATLYKVIFR
jgi:hypothetical protein